jgi:hypothetical protein
MEKTHKITESLLLKGVNILGLAKTNMAPPPLQQRAPSLHPSLQKRPFHPLILPSCPPTQSNHRPLPMLILTWRHCHGCHRQIRRPSPNLLIDTPGFIFQCISPRPQRDNPNHPHCLPNAPVSCRSVSWPYHGISAATQHPPAPEY